MCQGVLPVAACGRPFGVPKNIPSAPLFLVYRNPFLLQYCTHCTWGELQTPCSGGVRVGHCQNSDSAFAFYRVHFMEG